MKKTLAIFLLSAFTCAFADPANTADLLPADNTVGTANQQQEGSPSAKTSQPKLIIVKPSSTSPSYTPPSRTSKHSKSKSKHTKNKSHSAKKKSNTSKQSKKTSKQKKHKPANQ